LYCNYDDISFFSKGICEGLVKDVFWMIVWKKVGFRKGKLHVLPLGSPKKSHAEDPQKENQPIS